MVSSRHRSSTATSESTNSSTPNTSATKLPKTPLEEWTTKEKLCLASLAIKHGNAWNSVARNMTSFVEKGRPDGWSNQKTCAAQFDRLMNELGVDKRPKRNEPSDGNSSSVIYKRMCEKRIKELEDSIVELRKLWLVAKSDLDSYDNSNITSDKSGQIKQQKITRPSQTTNKQSITQTVSSSTLSLATTSNKSLNRVANTSTSSESSEKPPTRALTRRESSRRDLEKTLSILCKEASEIKAMNLLTKPTQELERENHDKYIFKHRDMSIINERLGKEVEDAYAVMNDLLLIFQNAIMFYPPGHKIYKTAIELRDKLVPQWEKALIERSRIRH